MIPTEFSVNTILLIVTAIGSIIAAVASILGLRKQYELPIIHVRDSTVSWTSEGTIGRYVEFRQPTEPPQWLVHQVKIRQEWIAKTGDQVRDNFGSLLGFRQGSDWKNRLVFNPPVANGYFVLHVDAPQHLKYSFDVVLRNQVGVRRRVTCFSS